MRKVDGILDTGVPPFTIATEVTTLQFSSMSLDEGCTLDIWVNLKPLTLHRNSSIHHSCNMVKWHQDMQIVVVVAKKMECVAKNNPHGE